MQVVLAEDALEMCAPEGVAAAGALLLAAGAAFPETDASRVHLGSWRAGAATTHTPLG